MSADRSPRERAHALLTSAGAENCWLWDGSINKNGYGQTSRRSKGRKFGVWAHRLVWEALVGPIPAGMELDHLCRKTSCVRPGHLEVVTAKENVLRGVGLSAQNARKNLCKRGHPFDSEWRDKRTGRTHRCCRKCNAEKARISYHRNKKSRALSALARKEGE